MRDFVFVEMAHSIDGFKTQASAELDFANTVAVGACLESVVRQIGPDNVLVALANAVARCEVRGLSDETDEAESDLIEAAFNLLAAHDEYDEAMEDDE